MKKISVIIPAWNEEKHIASAIRALKLQNYPRKDFEIIVVDNNSTDHTIKKAHDAGADKVVKEHEQGTNMARNKGVEVAEGNILCFIDADCVPPHNWLSHIENNLKNPRYAATGGGYDYGFKGLLRKANLFYTGILFKNVPRIIQFIFRKKDGVIIAGNFAIKKKTFIDIGKFPPIPFFGDDTAIAIEIVRKSGEIFFDPSLIVQTSPRRLKNQGLLKMAIIYAYHHFKIYFKYTF